MFEEYSNGHGVYYMNYIKYLTKDDVLNIINDGGYFILPEDVSGDEFFGSIDLGDHDEYTIDKIIEQLGKYYYIHYISIHHLTPKMVINYVTDYVGELNSDMIQNIIIRNNFNLSDFLLEYTRQQAEQGNIVYYADEGNIERCINRCFEDIGCVFLGVNLEPPKAWLREFLSNPNNQHLLEH